MRSDISLPPSLGCFIKTSSRSLMACLAYSMRFRSLTRFGSNNATSKRSRQSPVSFGRHDGLLRMNGLSLANSGPIVKLIIRFHGKRPPGRRGMVTLEDLVFDPAVMDENRENRAPMAVNQRSIAYLQGRARDHPSHHSLTGQNTKVVCRWCPGGQVRLGNSWLPLFGAVCPRPACLPARA